MNGQFELDHMKRQFELDHYNSFLNYILGKHWQSSNILAEEIRESGRSFQSLIVCGKKILSYASLLADGI